MAVHSNTFGGLQLTGEDAKKFTAQTRSGRANDAAKESAARGKLLAKQLILTGVAQIDKKVG